ncbi:hypothetical protein DH2020_016285 [Rehmannia glutinosa]|uniref:Exocyst subunit Exo70 family protein n=1 Tax=Rehmannia glutinosa TaxID=99300 RepID=A0ABR0WNJ9_REHGL
MGSSLSQQSAVDTISQWRSKPANQLIFDSGRREVSHYFEAVDRLHQSSNLKGFNSELISAAMARLKNEFAAVLSRHADRYHSAGPISTTEWSSVTDSTAYVFRYGDYIASDPPSIDEIAYLKNIAVRMNSNGNLLECIRAYKSVRKSFLQSQLKRLRFEELSVDFATALFGFAEAISLSNQPYERMDKILGVYGSLLWCLPDANALFVSESGKGIRNSISEILSKIENDVIRMLYDFENAVLHEISNVSDDRGGVHQSTEYVMDQITVIAKNKDLLANLIKLAPSLNFGDVMIPQEALGDINTRSFLELHLILIIVVLQINLETKCQSYQNPSLGQLFMMNNVRYIVRKIQGSNELQHMIGDSYLRKLDENFRFAMTSYQALTCSKFTACFADKGLYSNRCCISRPSKTAVRKRIKDFNAVFEEFKRSHSSWTIPDLELRDEVRFSITGELVPAYQNFLEKLESENIPEMKVLLENNIKYSAEDLQAFVLENFQHAIN